MHRRHLLTLLGSASVPLLSGCVTSRDVLLENFSTHNDIDVSLTGEVIQQPTEDGPLRIELSLTNDGPKRELEFFHTPPLKFTSSDIRVVVVPDDRESITTFNPEEPDKFVPETPEDGCWRSLNRIPVGGGRQLERRTFNVDDTLTERYTLLATPEAEACFPAGTHRFTNRIHVNDDHQLHFDLVIP